MDSVGRDGEGVRRDREEEKEWGERRGRVWGEGVGRGEMDGSFKL